MAFSYLDTEKNSRSYKLIHAQFTEKNHVWVRLAARIVLRSCKTTDLSLQQYPFYLDCTAMSCMFHDDRKMVTVHSIEIVPLEIQMRSQKAEPPRSSGLPPPPSETAACTGRSPQPAMRTLPLATSPSPTRNGTAAGERPAKRLLLACSTAPKADPERRDAPETPSPCPETSSALLPEIRRKLPSAPWTKASSAFRACSVAVA
eukprot:765209-Hanusia_phi.AAC.3